MEPIGDNMTKQEKIDRINAQSKPSAGFSEESFMESNKRVVKTIKENEWKSKLNSKDFEEYSISILELVDRPIINDDSSEEEVIQE